MFEFLGQFPTSVFSTAAIVLGLLLVYEVLGAMLGFGPFDADTELPDLDIDLEVEGAWFDFLRIRELPFSMILTLMTAFFSMIGFSSIALLGTGLVETFFVPIVSGAVVGAWGLTKMVSHKVGSWLRGPKAHTENDLVGLTGVIKAPHLTQDHSAELLVFDPEGGRHYVMGVLAAGDKSVLHENETVKIEKALGLNRFEVKPMFSQAHSAVAKEHTVSEEGLYKQQVRAQQGDMSTRGGK